MAADWVWLPIRFGDGPSRPDGHESYLDDVHTTFDRRAPAVVRPTGTGTITVAAAHGGEPVSVTLTAR